MSEHFFTLEEAKASIAALCEEAAATLGGLKRLADDRRYSVLSRENASEAAKSMREAFCFLEGAGEWLRVESIPGVGEEEAIDGAQAA